MPFTPLFGTGFEDGGFLSVPETRATTMNSTAAYVHTGTYSVRCGSSFGEGFCRWQMAPYGDYSDLYVTFWMYPYGNSWHNYANMTRWAVRTDDDHILWIRWEYDRFKVYYDSTLLGTGTIVPPVQQFMLIEIHFKIGNPDGVIEWKVDQVLDGASYTGNTNIDGTSTHFVNFWFGTTIGYGDGNIVDDLCVGYGDWPGDIRFDILQVTGDSSVAWSRSTGATNWSLVDEKPPSDTDYVYSITNNQKDLYTLADWSGSGKIPLFINVGMRAWKNTATGSKVDVIFNIGGSDYVVKDQEVETLVDKYWFQVMKNPNGNVDWTNAVINAMTVGVKALILG